jgi:hypothetical protein
MLTSRTVAGAALLALMLTSCSTTQPQAAPTVSVAPAATPAVTPTPTAIPNENGRGQLIKKIGETATRANEREKAPSLKFKVTSIQAITCDAPFPTPPKGQIIAVSLEIESASGFVGPLTVNGTPGLISFHPRDWKGYTDTGTRMNTVESDATQNCLADETRLLPDYVGKGEKLNGIVLLDVATPSGSIAFEPDGPGWIWEYSV